MALRGKLKRKAYRFYLKEELEEEFSSTAEALVQLRHATT
jgi:hypothetical protein